MKRRRADAERSRAAILEAAIRLLNARPDASIDAIAAAAGVTRQTVYAHFSSRDQLLAAVVDRMTAEAVAAMDAVDLEGPAAEALLGLLEAGWRTAERYPSLHQIASVPVSAEVDRERHEPVTARFLRVIRRGQKRGELDGRLPPKWLVAAIIALGHAAAEEVANGRMASKAALAALRTSVLRLVGSGAGDRPAGAKRARLAQRSATHADAAVGNRAAKNARSPSSMRQD